MFIRPACHPSDTPTHLIASDITALVGGGQPPPADNETQLTSRAPAKVDPVVRATEILTAAGFGHAPNAIIVSLGEVGPLGQTTKGLVLRSVGKIDNSESQNVQNLPTAIATIEQETGLKCSSNNIRWLY